MSIQQAGSSRRNKWVALVDGTNFFVSCERAFSPRLHGRPVGVMSNNDGCIIARSDELKALGVPMGAPVHKIQHLIRRHRIALLSSNFTLYADMNRRLNDILSCFSDRVEPYSVDESFVELSGFFTDGLLEQGRQIEQAIAQQAHLPVGVGIAQTRTLAKLANSQAKLKRQGPKVSVLDADADSTCQLLEATPVEEVWGVGKRLAERLRRLGIDNAWQLREAPEAMLRKRFSVTLARIQMELKGQPCHDGSGKETAKKQLRVSRSFGRASDNQQEVLDALRHHVQRAAEKLREQKSLVKTFSIFLRTNPFRSDRPQHSDTLLYQFDQPTADTTEMLEAARKLLRRLWREGYHYHKAGVLLMELVDASPAQLSVLETSETQNQRLKRERLMQVMDRVNLSQGRGSVTLGVGMKEAGWKARQEKRSPAYTTSWQELPKVVAR
ncbi:DNA polymerase V [Marinospirillum celere]|uniref:DNA polymerase V n=1 Tax=Marinospirillum celere TaxID=1122252 RepID=A0A1I1ERD8_9GAMM|nr:Y-family DNA polymerase [Marinospirillum celere]SFB89651.1 DNA polymerase V [Marinospirillum celere]